MNANRHSQAGFSLIEMLVAAVIMITVTAGVLAVLHPSHSSSRIQPEVADMQQRLRVGVQDFGQSLWLCRSHGQQAEKNGWAETLLVFFHNTPPIKQSMYLSFPSN